MTIEKELEGLKHQNELAYPPGLHERIISYIHEEAIVRPRQRFTILLLATFVGGWIQFIVSFLASETRSLLELAFFNIDFTWSYLVDFGSLLSHSMPIFQMMYLGILTVATGYFWLYLRRSWL